MKNIALFSILIFASAKLFSQTPPPPPPPKDERTPKEREATEHAMKGQKLFKNKEYQAALKEYDLAVELDRYHNLALIDRALVYIALGRTDDACKEWNKLKKRFVQVEYCEKKIKEHCQ